MLCTRNPRLRLQPRQCQLSCKRPSRAVSGMETREATERSVRVPLLALSRAVCQERGLDAGTGLRARPQAVVQDRRTGLELERPMPSERITGVLRVGDRTELLQQNSAGED